MITPWWVWLLIAGLSMLAVAVLLGQERRISRLEAQSGKRPTCAAVRYSDQMICERCAQTWDANDAEPLRASVARK